MRGISRRLSGRPTRSVVELLADSDRPGGCLLLMDRIRQSYVDLDDPTYLDFEYMQAFADVRGRPARRGRWP